jgi:hypothetical protein
MDRERLDAEQFAIEAARRGIPSDYWSAGLKAAEDLLNADDALSNRSDRADTPSEWA